MAKLLLVLLKTLSKVTNFEGKNPLVSFEDGCQYIVELSSGTTYGKWVEEHRAFEVSMPDGSTRLMEPSFSDPKSELVVWEKLS